MKQSTKQLHLVLNAEKRKKKIYRTPFKAVTVTLIIVLIVLCIKNGCVPTVNNVEVSKSSVFATFASNVLPSQM